MILVSKKSARIRVFAAHPRCGGQPAAKPAQIGKHILGRRPAMHGKAFFGGMQLDFITSLQAKFAHEFGGQPDSQRITPFRDLHESDLSQEIYISAMYIFTGGHSTDPSQFFLWNGAGSFQAPAVGANIWRYRATGLVAA